MTISFRIPKDLFESIEEYKNLRIVLTDYIEKFYEEFKERRKFRARVKQNIHRKFRSFSEFANKKPIREDQ